MSISQLINNPFANTTPDKMQKIIKLIKILGFVMGGVFATLSLIKMITMATEDLYTFRYIALLFLSMSAYAVLCVGAFTKKKIFSIIGFAALSVAWLLCLIGTADSLMYYLEALSYGVNQGFFTTLTNHFRNILLFVNFSAITAGIILIGTNVSDKFKGVIRKYWFTAVLCFALAYVLDFSNSIICIIEYGKFSRYLWDGMVFTSALIACAYMLFVVLDPYGILPKPVKPVAPVAPVQPAPVAPVQPAPVAPVQPAPVAPVQPAPVTPVQPAHVAPVQPAQSVAPVYQTPAQPADTLEQEIRKYKDLLDAGMITEEDFNAKKRQLLGL